MTTITRDENEIITNDGNKILEYTSSNECVIIPSSSSSSSPSNLNEANRNNVKMDEHSNDVESLKLTSATVKQSRTDVQQQVNDEATGSEYDIGNSRLETNVEFENVNPSGEDMEAMSQLLLNEQHVIDVRNTGEGTTINNDNIPDIEFNSVNVADTLSMTAAAVTAPVTYNVDAILVVDDCESTGATTPSSTSFMEEPLLVDAEPIIDETVHQQHNSGRKNNTIDNNRKTSTKKNRWIMSLTIAALVLIILVITLSIVFSRNENAKRDDTTNIDGTNIGGQEIINPRLPSNVLDVSTYNHVTRHGLLFSSHIDCSNTTTTVQPYALMLIRCGNTIIWDGLEALKLEQWSNNINCTQTHQNAVLCNATIPRNASKFSVVLLCGRQAIVEEEPIATVQIYPISGTECQSEPTMNVGFVRFCSKSNSTMTTTTTTTTATTTSNVTSTAAGVDDGLFYNIQSSMRSDVKGACPFTRMVTSAVGNWSYCQTKEPCTSLTGTYPCSERIGLPGITVTDNMHNFVTSSSASPLFCPMIYEPLNETAASLQLRTIFRQSDAVA
jgi:hypothetical protein